MHMEGNQAHCFPPCNLIIPKLQKIVVLWVSVFKVYLGKRKFKKCHFLVDLYGAKYVSCGSFQRCL